MKKPHQHFIPRVYLRNFAHTNNDNIYLVDGFNKPEKKVIPDLSIRDICVEKDLYTLKNLDGYQKYKIENFFMNNIESKYPDTYRILVTEKKEFIDPKERMNILITTLSMYFRTPKFLNQFSDFSARLIKGLRDKHSPDFIDFMGANISLKKKSFEEIKKQIKEHNRIDYIKAQFELFNQLLALKMFCGLSIIELVGEGEFITCDNPVEIRNAANNEFNLFDTANSIYVPLDSKHALFIAPIFEGSIVNQVFYRRDNFFQHVALNNSLLKNAERWVLGTKTGISKFLKDEEEYGKPAEGNHPIIKKFETSLEVLETMVSLIEKGISNQNVELVTFFRDLPNHPLYQESLDFQDAYKQMKERGLDI